MMLTRWFLVVSLAARVARLMIVGWFGSMIPSPISCSTTVIIDALLLAHKDKVDVINLSLGE